VPAIASVLERCGDDTWLLMENSAGAGGTVGRSIDELATLFERLDRHPRLGICLDTCHLYVSGYDVTDPAALDALLEDVDARIGLDRLRALHVNDSATPFGSNRDRHANILEGELGEKLGVFLGHPSLQGLPAYLEVEGKGKGPDEDEVRKLRELHAAATSA
jgi:deoxyribonuclease-4